MIRVVEEDPSVECPANAWTSYAIGAYHVNCVIGRNEAWPTPFTRKLSKMIRVAEEYPCVEYPANAWTSCAIGAYHVNCVIGRNEA